MKKRILTIQDYSCLGRCSLTVAIPLISTCGIEVVGLPTAIFSNHTAFPHWKSVDLSDYLETFIHEWDEYNLEFDAIYTGYLSDGQIPIVERIISSQKKDKTIVFVDPAFADNGKIYAGFGEEHTSMMAGLISKADLIKPNVTEACLLTKTKMFNGKERLSSYIKLSDKLLELGSKAIVLTGLSNKKGKIGCLIRNKDICKAIYFKRLEGNYHGTGDLFSSALISSLIKGKDLEASVRIAHYAVSSSIKENLKNHIDGKLYGPEFEINLPRIALKVNK